jgi:hypothetical protein
MSCAVCRLMKSARLPVQRLNWPFDCDRVWQAKSRSEALSESLAKSINTFLQPRLRGSKIKSS